MCIFAGVIEGMIQAITNPFAHIINGPKQFVIPVFQRDYCWGPEQCDRMWSDVLKSADDDGQHFLGSFVYVDEQVGVAFGSWLVVDGQQRLTTLTLLMIALRDHLVEIQWSGSGVSVAQIDDFFLKNTHESGERRYRLALRRRDNDTLQALVDGRTRPRSGTTPRLSWLRMNVFVLCYGFPEWTRRGSTMVSTVWW